MHVLNIEYLSTFNQDCIYYLQLIDYI